MASARSEWLEFVRREYLRGYIAAGGASVKFVVARTEEAGNQLRDDLRRAALEENYAYAHVDSAKTPVHKVEKVFHEIAQQVDWDGLAKEFVRQLLRDQGCELPNNGAFTLEGIAALNRRDPVLLRGDIQASVEQGILKDFAMSREFRFAMVRLCMAPFDRMDTALLSNVIKEWLRGQVQLMSALRQAVIFQRIARHNARDMILSLTHWLRRNGKFGLVLTLDIARYLVMRPRNAASYEQYYTTAAALDAYEVLRQFVDATDELEGCLLVVLAPTEFLATDSLRGLKGYEALQNRIWDDVRDEELSNPFAPLVRLET